MNASTIVLLYVQILILYELVTLLKSYCITNLQLHVMNGPKHKVSSVVTETLWYSTAQHVWRMSIPSFQCIWCHFLCTVQCVPSKNTDTYPPLFPGAVWPVCFVFLTLWHPNSPGYATAPPCSMQTYCVFWKAGWRSRACVLNQHRLWWGWREQRHEQLSETQQRRRGMSTWRKTTLKHNTYLCCIMWQDSQFLLSFALPLTHMLIKTPGICFLAVSLPVKCPHKRQALYTERWPWEPTRMFVWACLWIRRTHTNTHSVFTYAKAWESVWVCMCIWMSVGSSTLSAYCHAVRLHALK